MKTWIFIEFPITDFQIEIRSKMTSNSQIIRSFRVCLINPCRSWCNCWNIKSWFQSNIFKTVRTVLTNYCDTLVLSHVTKVTWHWISTLEKKFCIIAFERDMIYQMNVIINGDLDKKKSMNFDQNQWNSMFLNGFDLAISITLILLNNLQCLQPSLFLDCLLFWLKRESVQPVLF